MGRVSVMSAYTDTPNSRFNSQERITWGKLMGLVIMSMLKIISIQVTNYIQLQNRIQLNCCRLMDLTPRWSTSSLKLPHVSSCPCLLLELLYKVVLATDALAVSSKAVSFPLHSTSLWRSQEQVRFGSMSLEWNTRKFRDSWALSWDWHTVFLNLTSISRKRTLGIVILCISWTSTLSLGPVVSTEWLQICSLHTRNSPPSFKCTSWG